MSVSAAEIRNASQYLRKHARKARIPPRRFAAAAKEQNASFSEVLRLIIYYYSAGDERTEQRHDQLNKGLLS